MIEKILEGLDDRIQTRVTPSEKKEFYELLGNDSKKVARLSRWGFLQALELARKESQPETKAS